LLLLRLSDSLSRLESLITVDTPNVTHIARVASEYTQLTYHATKARQERCLFLQTLQPRIDNVHASLTTTLSTLFINSLSAQSYPDIALSLRTYDLLGLYSDAEHVLRTHLVRPFIQKVLSFHFIYHSTHLFL
jgi:conserved oligomeric Golgi complex subunit 2